MEVFGPASRIASLMFVPVFRPAARVEIIVIWYLRRVGNIAVDENLSPLQLRRNARFLLLECLLPNLDHTSVTKRSLPSISSTKT